MMAVVIFLPVTLDRKPKQMEYVMQNHSFLFDQVLSNWYDRDETDEEILVEMIRLGGSSYREQAVTSIQRYLENPLPDDVKAEQIRNAVWRYLPDDPIFVLSWLSNIQKTLAQQ